MAVVETGTYTPYTIESGSTVRFTVSNASYLATLWTLQFVLNDGVNAPTIVAGTTSGTSYIVTLTATQTAALATGRYTWGEVFTSISTPVEKAVGNDGTLDVLPGIMATATPTTAQNMVTLLTDALAKLGRTDKLSVNINGQSFTRAFIGEYQKQLTYWQARVISEQNKIAALRGKNVGGEVGVTFIRPRATLGLYPQAWE